MIRTLPIIAVFWLALTVPAIALAQSASPSISGVWKVTAVETREVLSGKVVRPFGDQPSGTFIFTPGGQMVGMQYAGNRKAPTSPNPTDAERAALHSSCPLTADVSCRRKKAPHYDRRLKHSILERDHTGHQYRARWKEADWNVRTL